MTLQSKVLIEQLYAFSSFSQLVHDKEINAEDEQVFLMKQQVCASLSCMFLNLCHQPQRLTLCLILHVDFDVKLK